MRTTLRLGVLLAVGAATSACQDPACTPAACTAVQQCGVQFAGEPKWRVCTQTTQAPAGYDFTKYCPAACSAGRAGALANCIREKAAQCSSPSSPAAADVVRSCEKLGGAPADPTCETKCASTRTTCEAACGGAFDACADCAAKCGLSYAQCEAACPRL